MKMFFYRLLLILLYLGGTALILLSLVPTPIWWLFTGNILAEKVVDLVDETKIGLKVQFGVHTSLWDEFIRKP